MKKCKFPKKDCNNRYFSSTRGKCCRLDEWKKKSGVCPYDKEIKSHAKSKKQLNIIGQRTLNVA